MPNRIGFISTRLAGTDGVSLETQKWSNTLIAMKHTCFYFAGECDWPADRSYVVPEAHFAHPDIQALTLDLFDNSIRTRETSQQVQKLKLHLKDHLYKFVEQFELDLLIVENALAIPMNIPLGLAITELIAETAMPTIAHHHDFTWERSRFAINGAEDYLRAAFPPTLPSIRHVVISSFANQQLALRTGAPSITLIPNVMDFDTPPQKPDPSAGDLRETLGIAPDEYFLLQPTRIVPRKRIELAIDLTRRLKLPAVLVISHSAGDEGLEYQRFLKEYAEVMNVRLIFGEDHFDVQGSKRKNRKIYSLADAYQQADLVTYPSRIEGFGNAFLETIYYKRPIVMSTYEIFKTDILPKGFQVIDFEDFVTEDTVQQARDILLHPKQAQKIVNANYKLAHRYYSYRILEQNLKALITISTGNDSKS